MKEKKALQIIEQIFDYNHRMYDYGKDIRCYGTPQKLRIDQIHVVDYIGRHPGCRLSDIAAAINYNLSTVSLQVKRLIKLDLVRKERSAQNQREIILSLTEDGEAAFKYHTEIDEHWVSSMKKELSVFREEELISIGRFMDIMLDDNLNV